MRHRRSAATAGLLALGLGAFAVGKHRGRPPCQNPDCDADAAPASNWSYCPDHEGVEVPIDG